MTPAVCRRLLQGMTLAAVCLTALFVAPLCAQKTALRALPAGAADLGPAPAEQSATATLYLQPAPERQAALVQFLSDVTSPASGSYHHWLTPASFQAQFGPDPQAYDAVTAFAQANGLRVADAIGFRVRLTGPVSAVEAAFGTEIHQATANGKAVLFAAQMPALPKVLSAAAVAMGRLDTLPEASPLALAADGAAVPASAAGSLADFATVVETNAARVVAIGGSACASSFTEAERGVFQLYLREAAAQGITVLAASGCADAGSSSFPASFPELAAFALPDSAGTAPDPGQPRPDWQNAPGLPADGLRAAPDATVTSLAVLAQTFETLLARAVPNPDGTPARLGNVAGTLYQLASVPGLYTQPDGRTGTWEAATGLGVLDPKILGQVFPMGSLSSSVSVTLSNPAAVHGQSITFSSTVKDISGKGNGAVPTGTVTWNFNNGISLGPVNLVNGTASVTSSQLPGAYGYTVTAQYSGDGNYGAASASTGFSIQPEAAGVSAVVNGSTPLGGNISVAVTVTSKSGVGTPVGSASVAPQGTADKNTYTVPLTGSNGTATATVTLPAVQGGNVTLLVNCVSTSGDFSCYVPVQATATVTTGPSATAIALTTSGNQTTLTATVTGAGSGFPTPTGNITFTDNGVNVGSATLNSSGQASVTFTTPSGSGHNYVATYGGDNNYAGSVSATAATGSSATTTVLTITPNPPVAGSTTVLNASIAYTAQGSAVPSGTVSFYEDGALVGSAQVVNGSAAISGTSYSGSSTHSFYAVYTGDNVYAPSTSATVNTVKNGALVTGTALTVAPNPPVSGATTTLTATISYSATPTFTPTGTVSFYMDGLLFGAVAMPAGSKTATLTSTAISSTSAHSFYAVYSGDANFTGSSSSTVVTQASGSAATTTSLTVNPSTPVSGSLTTLTATIGYTASGSAVPTGTVSFYQDGTQIGSGTVNGGTLASMSSTTLSGTTAHSFYAAYNGDANYAASRSSSISTKAQTGSGITTTTITSSASTVTAGGSVTFTATVAPATSGATTPTGTVTFTSSTQGALGTATLNSSGVATLTVALSTAGTQSVSAAYSGDTNYAASASATPAGVTVSSAVTPAITLTVSPSTAVYGANVTLTSNVTVNVTSGSTPSGSITWTLTPNNGGTAITYTGTLNATSATTATASAIISAPAVGTYTVTATCSGTNISCTGLTASAGLAVTKVSTTTSITASPSTPVAGQPEILTATITPATGSSAVCAGSVSFYVGGSYAGNGSVSGNQATFITTLPSTTSNVIYAIYTGDGNCSPSTSNALTLTTPPAATTGTNSASSTSVLYSSSVTFTVVITSTATASNPYPGAPTGAVNFYDTFNGLQTLIGSATLVPSGVQSSIATFSTTGLQAGNHSVDALFAGSTKYSPVDAGVAVVAVTDFSTTFSPPSATVTKGQSATVLVTLAPINGFSGQVALNCTPPASTQTTCVITPSVVSGGGGVVTMMIGTTAPLGHVHPGPAGSLAFVGALAAFLWPSRRRLRFVLAALLLAAGLTTLSGCTTVQSEGTTTGGGGSGGGGNSSGTPSGTQLFTIVASGTDGRTTNRHTLQYQLTVQ